MKEDGSGYEPLLTITEEDIAEWGVEGKPQQGRITLKEFEERGHLPGAPPSGRQAWLHRLRGLPEGSREQPAQHRQRQAGDPLPGSRGLIKGYGFTEIDPIPTYQPRKEGYEDTFADWEKKIKGEYPLQVINPHYPRRSHSVFDNVTWLREAFPSMVMLNSQDAAARGIKDGDTVLITSRHGKVLRRAHVTDLIMPGVVGLPHGAWVEMDEEKQIDKAGADNILCGGIPSGQGISAWNSCIVEVTRYDEPLAPDHTWEPRIPLK